MAVSASQLAAIHDELSALRRLIETQDTVMQIDEAAEFTGLSKSAVYEKTAAHELPHYKRGKRLYFKRSELVEWLTSRPVRTAEATSQMAESSRSERQR